MMEMVSWLSDNWTTVVGVAGTVVMGASIIVKGVAPYTDTQVDDKAATWLGKLYKFLNKLALNTDSKDTTSNTSS